MVYMLRVEEVKPVAELASGESTRKNMSSLAGKNDKAGRTEGVKNEKQNETDIFSTDGRSYVVIDVGHGRGCLHKNNRSRLYPTL